MLGHGDEDGFLDHLLHHLHPLFGSSGILHTSPSPSSSPPPDAADPWEDLSKHGFSLASIVQTLVAAMDKGRKLSFVAADIYLGLMLAPGSPLYSLFSQLSFNSLLGCIRKGCRPAEQSTSPPSERSSGKCRGGKRKGKQMKEQRGLDSDMDELGVSDPMEKDDAELSPQERLDMVCLLLRRLKFVLQVLHLGEHQEILKTLVELLVELPHIVGEIQISDGNDGTSDSRSKKATFHHHHHHHHHSSAGASFPVPNLCFEILENLLDPSHGSPMDTVVMLLKLLAPSILLVRAGGNPYQKTLIREQTLKFVTRLLKTPTYQTLRSAISALPRYLTMKAPEKTDPRAVAVESVMIIVKELPAIDQWKFCHFVVKLSRRKPRHRLFAVDLVLALFSELPDPLGLDKEACCNVNEKSDMLKEAAPMGGENSVMLDDAEENMPSPGSTSVETQTWWGVACLEALLHRCSDKVPSIRARALHNLAEALELLSSDIRNRAMLQNLLGLRPPLSQAIRDTDELTVKRSACLSSLDTPSVKSPTLGGQTPSPEPSMLGPGASPLTPGLGHGDLGSLLRRRCLDDKVAVRKSALLLMTKSASLLGRPPDEVMLKAMGNACSDLMLSIRKAALSALSEMLRKFPSDANVVTEWFQSALPLVMDNEVSIQEECLNLFEELVIDRIAVVASARLPGCSSTTKSAGVSGGHFTPEEELERLLPPGILVALKAMADDSAIVSCTKRVCTILGKRKRLRAGITLALQNIITASKHLWFSYHKETISAQECWTAPPGTWLLLAEVSAFVPKAIGWEFLRTHWQLLDKHKSSSTTPKTAPQDKNVPHCADWAIARVHLLQTISNVAIELPPNAAADLATELLERLESFDMEPMEVGAHVKALHVLCIRKATSEEEGDRLISTWVEELLEQAGMVLDSYISMINDSTALQNKDSFGTPKSDKIRKKAAEKSHERNSSAEVANSASQIIPAIFTIGALVLICPKTKIDSLSTIVRALITSIGKQLNCEDALLNNEINAGVHAQAWVTLGKMCLANYELAKTCVPLFLQELGESKSAAVRNNIMIAMTDFVVRYTSLIDGNIHKLTNSLRDSCEIVRRQGFVLLAQLLQRDYLKWRGTLFHRFLLALVDESEKIRQLADFLFSSILKTKAPLLAYNSFVETIFVLNDCHGHASHIEMLYAPESERKLFTLRGNADTIVKKRMHIYECLLKQMAPEHILATSAKLCADILASAADGILDLSDSPVQCVLEDSLRILASKEMRIGGNKGAAVNSEALEGEEDGAAAFVAAKGRVVTQLAKRNLVQNAIPIFIELKRLLESRNSPLTGMLMECMRVMLKEYKNEIEEILVADKQLQKEIMYDMQKHEAAKAKAKVVAAATAVLSPRSATMQPRNESVADPVGSKKSSPSIENGNAEAIAGKENAPPSSSLRVQEGANRGSIGVLQSKRKHFMSPDSSTRVGCSNEAATTPAVEMDSIVNGLRSSSAMAKTPIPIGGGALTPILSSNTTSIPSEGSGQSDRIQSNIASAVANVVAEASAAAVLHDVARGTATPLQAMSLPKLHPTVPSTVKKASFISSVVAAAAAGGDGEHVFGGEANLESVRRRQSFSSISIPQGSIFE